ncbi:hypothetical protein GCG54_00015347 [Colletotrichum gloeosporioides]|uniref:Uncharacterized protein n=1 Tax=Colletotrichum gloeosporioides TaxID=474922 RepID=A0A8H4FFJ0_COLGL|nr:uncharacterized protein GCG54_00015347 [Colletotrichum gloeosporioides]KAF3799159.1 hypothetical protein GCG54_00015347 [Colletotrichum gloeosporioides]
MALIPMSHPFSRSRMETAVNGFALLGSIYNTVEALGTNFSLVGDGTFYLDLAVPSTLYSNELSI